MQVSELIERLRKMPAGASIWIRGASQTQELAANNIDTEESNDDDDPTVWFDFNHEVEE